jgi:hypothetical protein
MSGVQSLKRCVDEVVKGLHRKLILYRRPNIGFRPVVTVLTLELYAPLYH